MQIESLNQDVQITKYPAQTIIVEWLDSNNERVAVAVAKHNYEFFSYYSDREYSQFLETVSWAENDLMAEIEKLDFDLFKQIKISGKLVITDRNAEIVFYQN